MSRKAFAWGATLALAMVVPDAVQASNPLVEKPANWASTPAARYAAMDGSACVAALKSRAIPFASVVSMPGVDTPVRISGPIRGVKFMQVGHSADEALNSDSSVVDCRLLLALHDFAGKLEARGVTDVGFISAYRHDESGQAKGGQRHPAGLAMDIAWMRKRDHKELNMLRDFHGRVGARTCGRRAEPPATRSEGAREIRTILCEAAGDRLFNLVLTPNYNTEHHNHVHLEVRRNIDWFLVQ